MQKTLTDLSQLSQGTSGLAATIEKLPTQISSVREATIKQLMGEVSAAGKAAMRQIIILIVIWWIGYIIARVIVQAISKKSSANRV
jgi:hypothetical protein